MGAELITHPSRVAAYLPSCVRHGRRSPVVGNRRKVGSAEGEKKALSLCGFLSKGETCVFLAVSRSTRREPGNVDKRQNPVHVLVHVAIRI